MIAPVPVKYRSIHGQQLAWGQAVESLERAREVGRLLVTQTEGDFLHALTARDQLQSLLLS